MLPIATYQATSIATSDWVRKAILHPCSWLTGYTLVLLYSVVFCWLHLFLFTTTTLSLLISHQEEKRESGENPLQANWSQASNVRMTDFNSIYVWVFVIKKYHTFELRPYRPSLVCFREQQLCIYNYTPHIVRLPFFSEHQQSFAAA